MRQIIDGAKFWKLPMTYIEELQRCRRWRRIVDMHKEFCQPILLE